MNKLDLQILDIVDEISRYNRETHHQQDTSKNSILAYQINFNVENEFPYSELIKIDLNSVIHEVLWTLSSYDKEYVSNNKTNIKYLLDNGVCMFNDTLYRNYTNAMIREHKGNKKLKLLSINNFISKLKTDADFMSEYGDVGPVMPKQLLDWGGYSEIVEKTVNYKETNANTLLVDRLGSEKIYMRGVNQLNNALKSLGSNPNEAFRISFTNVSDNDDLLIPNRIDDILLYSQVMNIEERIDYCEDNVNSDDVLAYMSKNDVSGWSDIRKHPLKQIKILDRFNIPDRKLSMVSNSSSVNVTNIPALMAFDTILLSLIAHVADMVPYELRVNMTDVYKLSSDAISDDSDGYENYKLFLNKEIESIYDFRSSDIVLKNNSDNQ